MPPTLREVSARIYEKLNRQFPEISEFRIYHRSPQSPHSDLILQLVLSEAAPAHVWNKLPYITSEACKLIPIAQVQIKANDIETHPVSVEDMQTLFPEYWKEGLPQVGIANLSAYSQFTTSIALRDRTILQISRVGVNRAVMLCTDDECPPGCPPLDLDDIIGLCVCDIAGSKAHEAIVAAINKAITSGRKVNFCYTAQFQGEEFERSYEAECCPMPDDSGAWLAVKPC